MHPVVVGLREFRETVLRPTREGREFFDRFYEKYASASGPVVEAMAEDDEVPRPRDALPCITDRALSRAGPGLP